jgi:hypothetical protein
MKKFISLALSIILISALSSSTSVKQAGPNKNLCGPTFTFLYNNIGAMVVKSIHCTDPFGNNISYTGLSVGTGGSYDISGVTVPSSNAAGIYSFSITVTALTTMGYSVKIVDQFNNVISCVAMAHKQRIFNISVNTTCAANYSIILDPAPC